MFLEYFIEIHPVISVVIAVWLALSVYFLYVVYHTTLDWWGFSILIGITVVLFLFVGWRLLVPVVDMPTKNSFGDSNGLFGAILICALPGIMITGPIAAVYYLVDVIKHFKNPTHDRYWVNGRDYTIDYLLFPVIKKIIHRDSE